MCHILKVVSLSVGKEIARAGQALRLWLPNVQGDHGFLFQVKNHLRSQLDARVIRGDNLSGVPLNHS
jgi:hypothetical protein